MATGRRGGILTRFRDVSRRDVGAVLRIGIISDTHGLLRPEVEAPLAGVAHIFHAGDIGSPSVIAGLQQIAPVIAIRGNVDTGRWAEHYPETQMMTLGGRRVYVLHDIKTLRLDPVSSGIDVIVCGHSHRPRIETIRGVLYLNPGSAGPRRLNLPITVATLDLTTGGLTPVIHHLGGTS
jgi:putative phosphoesterase